MASSKKSWYQPLMVLFCSSSLSGLKSLKSMLFTKFPAGPLGLVAVDLWSTHSSSKLHTHTSSGRTGKLKSYIDKGVKAALRPLHGS